MRWICVPVDYILFLTVPVTLAPSENEVCDTKWVTPSELKALMEELDRESMARLPFA